MGSKKKKKKRTDLGPPTPTLDHPNQMLKLLDVARKGIQNGNSKETSLQILKQSDQGINHYQNWSEKLSMYTWIR